MVEGAPVQATPSAPILSPPRVTHNRGVAVSHLPHQSVLSVGPLATPCLASSPIRIPDAETLGTRSKLHETIYSRHYHRP